MTNEKQQKIMERINNLLNKTVANGCTPEEAAAAATMAQKLIAKHHVDMREFNESEDVDSDEEYCSREWQTRLATVLANNTCCKMVYTVMGRGKRRLTFIGRDTERMAVLKMYDKLSEACQRGLTAEKRRYKEIHGTTAGVEHSYTLGFIRAVQSAMNEQCRALQLVTPEEVTNKMQELFPHCRTSSWKQKSVLGDCYANGKLAGQDAAGRKRLAM